MLKYFRTRLAWKVFLTYLLVILVVLVVFITTTNLSVPSALERHMARMGEMMPGSNMMGGQQGQRAGLLLEYQAAVNEAITLAAAAALVAALLASFLISRKVVGPIQNMMRISNRVAEGDYSERLDLPSNRPTGQLDELNQLAVSLNRMASRLEETESMRRQLIGDVTHELRTPLTVIKGYMEGLTDGVLAPVPETFQQVHDEADRLQRLVNDLQELSRVEAGAYQLSLETLPVNELVRTIANRLGSSFEQKGIKLEIDLPQENLMPFADRDRILQVLTNLLGNSLQYTMRGGEVCVRAVRNKNEVLFTIQDTGIGIAPDHLPHVFDRFYRTDKSRTRASGGSGIGLSIAQALVKAHHGSIWAESPGEGKGSSFHFTLPAAPPHH